MRFFLIVNLDKENAEACAKQVIKKLLSLGGEVLMASENGELADGFPAVTLGKTELLVPSSDLVISIGGDGTLIHAAKYAVPFDKPVLGINTGASGFSPVWSKMNSTVWSGFSTGIMK
jgi:NAD+ kinase